MGFDPTNSLQVGIGVTAFVASLAAVFLFVNGSNEKLARTLGFTMLFFAVWSWFGFAYQLTDDVWLQREFRIISLIFQLLGQIFTVQYAYVYFTAARTTTWFDDFLYWLMQLGNAACIGFFTLDMFGSQFIVGEVSGTALERLTPHPGPLLIWFFGTYLFVMIACGWIMARRVIHEKGGRFRAGVIMTTSIVAAYLFGATGILVWFGVNGPFTFLRALAMPLFVVAAFYTITNYRLFNVRVAAAEVFIFAMWGFLFWRVLLHHSFEEAVPDITVFIVVITLGIFMIRSITKELAVRIKLEEVSKQLQVLNGSLESKVIVRTKELARSQEHIEQVVEHLPVGLIELEASGTIVRINDVAEKLFDIKQDAAIHTKLAEHPILASVLGKHIRPGSFDAHLDTPRDQDLEIALAPLLLEQGEGFIAIIRDVTDRRRLERAKNDFVATAAHQLRTPLAAIKWTFDLLGSDTLNETQKQVVAQGATGVANMQKIAEGLMMSIRTAEGVGNYTFENTDPSVLIKKVLTLVTPLAEKKGIRINTTIAPDLPIISVDPEQIGFAIQNLLDNAIKYTPQEGTVSLKAHSDLDTVMIEVKDSGIGISEEDQARLFEKFFRAQKATEMATDGSGLGLAIAKSIVKAHMGDITVASKEGSGSTFTITLPRTRNLRS